MGRNDGILDIHAGNDVTNSSDNDRVRDDFYKEAAKKHKCLLWVQNIDVYEKYGHLDVCPSTCRTYLAFDRDSDNHTFRYRNGTCIPQGD